MRGLSRRWQGQHSLTSTTTCPSMATGKQVPPDCVRANDRNYVELSTGLGAHTWPAGGAGRLVGLPAVAGAGPGPVEPFPAACPSMATVFDGVAAKSVPSSARNVVRASPAQKAALWRIPSTRSRLVAGPTMWNFRTAHSNRLTACSNVGAVTTT